MNNSGITRKQLFDQIGKLQQIVEELQEIEKLRAEAFTRERWFSERLLANCGGTLWSVDTQGRFLEISPLFSQILGCLPEKLDPANLLELIDQPHHEAVLSLLRDTADTGQAEQRFCFRTCEGKEHWCDLHLFRDERHNPLRIVALEPNSWHRLLDRAPIMLWIAAAPERWIFANQRCREFMGIDLDHDAASRWKDRVHTADVDRMLAARQHAHGAYHVVYRIMRSDGVYRHVLELGSPGGIAVSVELDDVLDAQPRV